MPDLPAPGTAFGRKPRIGPRGRAVDPTARAVVRAALGTLELRRDLLIEHLHALQNRFGALREGHLVALADLLRIAPVEVFETASFYAHFNILPDDAPALPEITIRVCDGLPCAMAGGHELLEALRARPPRGARAVAAPCMGACAEAPACSIEQGALRMTMPQTSEAAIARAIEHDLTIPPPAPRRATAIDAAAWPVLREVREGRLTRDAMLATLDESGLRGMGGAGFPVARKWRAVLAQPGPRQLVVNADEGEPGTFKDRYCLRGDPSRFLEGMLLAAHAIEAAACWIYLRDEYWDLQGELVRAIAAMVDAGLAGMPIHLRRGAGADICGEETALLESLEGKRGYPRHKPPFPGEYGLFGQPTLIHNVETLWWLPEIFGSADAATRFTAAGLRGAKGRRLFSLSGRVRAPGVYDAPSGITARELITRAGGMAAGHRFAAYLPGGASGGILPAAMADLPLDFGALEPHGCFIGSAAMIVLSDRDDLAEAARNLVRFFRDESCGQCTPCRVGTAKAARLLDAPVWDRALLNELARAMADGSICGLGQAAMNPVLSLLRHFPPEAVP